MLDFILIISIIKFVFYVLVIFLACIYSIPIIFLKRFRNPTNILTANICLSCIICSIYWMIYVTLQIIFSENLNNWNCSYFQYFQTIVNCEEIYALCNISLNRYCIILYNNKIRFKTQQWTFICMTIQWFIGIILPLPLFYLIDQTCGQMNQDLWLRIYILLIVLIIPTLLFLFINGTILFHAHSSRQRIVPSNIVNRSLVINNRDIRLTKRMLILLFLFLCGWSPVYIVFTIENSYNLWVEALKLLAELSLLGEVINLYLYNQKIRIYLKNRLIG